MKKIILMTISLVALAACAEKASNDKAATDTKKPAADANAKTAKPAPEAADAKKAAPNKPDAAKMAAIKAALAAPSAGDKPAAAANPAAGAQPAAMPPKTIPAPADVAAAPKDAIKSATGLASKVITKGTGKVNPKATDTVTVHYTGWTTDGKMFDSSVLRGQPTSFPLNGVIPGWTEGVALMVVGEKRRFWIPGKLAYGDKPTRPGAPAGTLVFDVELIDIQKPASPEEIEAQFKIFKAAVTKAADAVCACKDMNCVQGAMQVMSTVRPPSGRPTPAHIAQLQPDMQRLQACGQKLQAAAGPAAPPAGRPSLPPPTGVKPAGTPPATK